MKIFVEFASLIFSTLLLIYLRESHGMLVPGWSTLFPLLLSYSLVYSINIKVSTLDPLIKSQLLCQLINISPSAVRERTALKCAKG